MTTSLTLHQHAPLQSENPVAEFMQDVLASTYSLYLLTHNYHWNVEGAKFVPLHKLFEEQYKELFEAIDRIAERIRALDEYALPFEGDKILDVSKMTSNALNKESDSDSRAERMLHNLILLNESVVKSCQMAKESAQELYDDETENLLVERITTHQKSMWMLRSVLK